MPRQTYGIFIYLLVSIITLSLTCTTLLAAPSPTSKETSRSEKANSQTKIDENEEEPGVPQENDSPVVYSKVQDLITNLIDIYSDLEEKKKLEAPWEQKWKESLEQIKQIKDNAKDLADDYENKRSLLLNIDTAERNFSQLMPSVNRYKKWAALMEAVMSRLSLIENDVRREMAPLYINHANVEKLSDSIKSLSTFTINLKQNTDDNKIYQKELQEAKNFIDKILERQSKDLETPNNLISEIQKAKNEIKQSLPKLWKDYYLQKPLHWLDANVWKYLPMQLDVMISGLEMRRSLELPTDVNGWRKTILRGIITFVFFGILIVLLRKQSWVPTDTNPTVDHIFRVSLPLICVGISFLVSSYNADGESYRTFMALGNILVILGQMFLAWDLRLLSSPNTPRQSSPLLRLFPLTCIAYILLYLPLLRAVMLGLWLISLIFVLIWRRFWPELDIADLKLEKGIRTFDCVVLWICLLLTLSGLPIFSVIFYLCCVSISLATELCLGGVDSFTYLNENQPSEGLRAIFSNIIVSLTAPIIMMIAVSSVLLWVATLPGGMTLMNEYLFKNVSVGSAEFNFFHVLIIISAFFLTKAIVSNGSRYISKLITSKKNSVDTTLVTPAQTAFTYTTWIIFALFVMHMLDIDLKNAAMVMTGLSVGIGMGLQSIVNNLFSGLLLIFGRMLQVGDVIEVGGISGRVVSISVRHTLVRTYDNAHIYVPNSEFISGHLINWSRNDTSVRTSVAVGVAYGSDTDLVVKILKSIVDKQENILRYPEPSVVFQHFGDSSLEFSVFFWVNKFDDRIATSTAVRLQIDKAFAENNIEIAYPQLDVHLKQKIEPNKSSVESRIRNARTHHRGLLKQRSSRADRAAENRALYESE